MKLDDEQPADPAPAEPAKEPEGDGSGDAPAEEPATDKPEGQ